MNPIRSLFSALCLVSLASAHAADPAASARLTETWRQAADIVGVVVELQAGGEPFVAISHSPTQGETVGAVVLLHDPWTSADSDEVVRPMRIGLAQHGWETLSLQLPAAYPHEAVAQWQAADEPVASRLAAALAWLGDRGRSNQVVLALGASAGPALRAIADQGPDGVAALVMVSTPADLSDAADREALAALSRPVLDIFAEHDRAAVTRAALERRLAVRELPELAYSHYRVAGARAGFSSSTALLLARVRGWLKVHASGRGGG
jgi:hypothetical protein